jgi:hypothetical protein
VVVKIISLLKGIDKMLAKALDDKDVSRKSAHVENAKDLLDELIRELTEEVKPELPNSPSRASGGSSEYNDDRAAVLGE